MISALLGYRLKCRTKNSKKNEVRVKLVLFDFIHWPCVRSSDHEGFGTGPRLLNPLGQIITPGRLQDIMMGPG